MQAVISHIKFALRLTSSFKKLSWSVTHTYVSDIMVSGDRGAAYYDGDRQAAYYDGCSHSFL